MTGSGTSCDDCTFKALELRRYRIQREILKKDKAACNAVEDNEKETLKVLAAETAAQNASKLKKVLSVKNL